MPRLRLGVALLVPPPHDVAVDGLRRALGDPALGRIPAHLTLVPPVNVRESDLDAALGVVRRAAAAALPLDLTLEPPETFLPANPVLYLPVSGDLHGLQRLREAVFEAPLSRPLTWPFVPHVTVADEAEPARIEAALAALADFRLNMTVKAVHLLQEGPGRRWQPVADVWLEAPAVIGRGGMEIELTRSGRPDHFAITARIGGAIAGQATCRIAGDGAALTELTVNDETQGRGVGTQLLAAVEALAAERGCREISAVVEPGTRAQRFLDGRGWTVDGSRLTRGLTPAT